MSFLVIKMVISPADEEPDLDEIIVSSGSLWSGDRISNILLIIGFLLLFSGFISLLQKVI